MICPNPDRDWLFAKAKEEANRFICVGGLAFSLRSSVGSRMSVVSEDFPTLREQGENEVVTTRQPL